MHIHAQKKSVSFVHEAERAWHVWHVRGFEDRPIFVTPHTTSVLDDGWRLIQKGHVPVWGSVLAYSQTAGRGQSRRPWYSPVGNVFAAVRLPAEEPFTTLAAAPAMAALVLRAFSHMGMDLHLKWPNDIVHRVLTQDGRENAYKVGGILLEERGGDILAGIGLNSMFAPEKSFLRENFALPAHVLPLPKNEKLQIKQDNNEFFSEDIPLAERLWLHLVQYMLFCYNSQLSEAFDWKSVAEQHLLWKNTLVTLHENDDAKGAPVMGILRGLGSLGQLILSVRAHNTHYGSHIYDSDAYDVSFFSGSLALAHVFRNSK